MKLGSLEKTVGRIHCITYRNTQGLVCLQQLDDDENGSSEKITAEDANQH
jgi:hypothetical protein